MYYYLSRALPSQLPISARKAKIYPLTRRRKSRTRRLISLSIAHPKKLAHGPNWRETAPFAALLLISTLTSKLWALFKILIFSLDCLFNQPIPVYVCPKVPGAHCCATRSVSSVTRRRSLLKVVRNAKISSSPQQNATADIVMQSALKISQRRHTSCFAKCRDEIYRVCCFESMLYEKQGHHHATD